LQNKTNLARGRLPQKGRLAQLVEHLVYTERVGGSSPSAPTITRHWARGRNMPAIKLSTIRVNKPWGRNRLWPGFADAPANGEPVGEIWFKTADDAPEPELLVKYLFTSERLSIQVHPDDDAARGAGYPRGKEEAWLILAAEPEATIALGTRYPVSREELRAAALDGSIESLMDWRRVKAGDIIYSPAGTVHAIGGGLTLIEVQQNVDLTYRLYDYGRPRELHLDAGIAVSNPVPFVDQAAPTQMMADREILVEGGKFVIERLRTNGNWAFSELAWLIPITGGGSIDSDTFSAGECWLLSGNTAITIDPDSEILLAYSGANRM
jgi:mannose-6-phosphate isomerase